MAEIRITLLCCGHDTTDGTPLLDQGVRCVFGWTRVPDPMTFGRQLRRASRRSLFWTACSVRWSGAAGCIGAVFPSGGGKIEFHNAYEPTTEHIRQVESALQRRVLRYVRRQGLLDEPDTAGMPAWQGSGEFSVDVSMRIEAKDRAGIERLVRYCAPPPLSPARGPPQCNFLTGLLDQTPAFHPATPDPIPDFEVDRSLPDDFDR